MTERFWYALSKSSRANSTPCMSICFRAAMMLEISVDSVLNLSRQLVTSVVMSDPLIEFEIPMMKFLKLFEL